MQYLAGSLMIDHMHTWDIDGHCAQVEGLRKEIKQLEMRQRAEPKPQALCNCNVDLMWTR